MLKNIIILLSVFVLLLGLCSCGLDDGESGHPSQTTTSSPANEEMTIATQPPAETLPNLEEELEKIRNYSPWYEVDNTSMSITGFYDGCLVNTFLGDYTKTYDVVITKNGAQVTDGTMQEGMQVSFHLDGKFIATYSIVDLWKSEGIEEE